MDKRAEDFTCHFDDFVLDLRARALFRLGPDRVPTPVPLGMRAFDILCVLIRHRGAYVSKQKLLDTVWPDVTVEDNNLTVQMSALRRVLDQGRAEGSCIQTLPGRGYCFIPPVTEMAGTTMSNRTPPGDTQGASPPEAMAPPATQVRPRSAMMASGLAIVLAGLVTLLVGRAAISASQQVVPPRLSVVVLPFQNLSGNVVDDYLADGITDDLTSDLAHVPGAFVIASTSARAYGRNPIDVKRFGQELGVRYVVAGSMRHAGTNLRVNVQLISTESGAQLWTDRFDEQVSDLVKGQDQVLARMRDGLGISLVEIEAARGLRERPTRPDMLDLILRARSLHAQPPTPQQTETVLALYERALAMDPDSVPALTGTATMLINQQMATGYWASSEMRERVVALVSRAHAIAPESEAVLSLSALFLRAEGRCQETIAAARRLVELFPNNKDGYYMLGWCETATGNANEEIPLLRTEALLNPRDPSLYLNERRMGYDLLLLGRDKDAIELLNQSLAQNPGATAVFRHSTYRMLAVAYARSGERTSARLAAAEADRLWPFDTVRGHFPEDSTSTVLAAQVQHYQDGLRLSGERDHADENADFGRPSDTALHTMREGYTPTAAPGATTISTGDLVRLIDTQNPLILDPMTYSWGRSLPGAIGLASAGLGGSVTDWVQERLHHKVQELTGGDLTKPIVAVGWNAERFDGRNLALRLVSMGYARVYWYRGGREAWEVNGLPEAPVVGAGW